MFKVESNEIFLYDIIGPSWAGYISDGDVIDALSSMNNQNVTLRINSPGGSVDHGIAIYNAMQRHKGKITVVVDSVAASIASIIALGGAELVMGESTKLMIHEPWTIGIGNSSQMRKTADVLDLYNDSIVDVYKKKTKIPESKIRDMLAAETWLSAKEAVELGFADRIDGVGDEPAVPQGMFTNVPNDVKEVKIEAGTRNRDISKIINRLQELKFKYSI